MLFLYILLLAHITTDGCAVPSYGCIRQSLEHNCRCPKCNFVIDKKDDIFPNFMCTLTVINSSAKRLCCLLFMLSYRLSPLLLLSNELGLSQSRSLDSGFVQCFDAVG